MPDNPDIIKQGEKAVEIITGGCLNGQTFDAETVSRILENDLAGLPVAAEVQIELYGLQLHTPVVELTCEKTTFLLRQPQHTDFEKDIPQFTFETASAALVTPPTAFLRIQALAKAPMDLQKQTERSLILLRLFGVAAVELGKQTFKGETLLNWFFSTVLGPGDIRRGRDVLDIEAGDIPAFERYWAAGIRALPETLSPFGNNQPASFIKIAYDRYCDSLFLRGGDDGRIAFAVMGLEALLLGRDEKVDLKYRLAMRAAKLLSRVGLSASDVQRLVRDAYDLRSVYVHGGHLSPKERAKSKRLGKDLNAIRYAILNFVRNELLCFVFGPGDKEALITTIDESLIDPRQDKELERMLRRVILIF